MTGTPAETRPRSLDRAGYRGSPIRSVVFHPGSHRHDLSLRAFIPPDPRGPPTYRVLQGWPRGPHKALRCPSSSRHPETNLAAGTRCGSWDLLTGIALVHRAVRQVEVVYGEFHNSLRNPFRLRHVPSVGQRSEPGTCGLWQLDTGPYQSGHNRGSGGPRLRKRRCQEDSSLACIRSHRPSSDRSGTRR